MKTYHLRRSILQRGSVLAVVTSLVASGISLPTRAHAESLGDIVYTFGSPSDTPVIGDWDGDGADQIGVQRKNVFYLDTNADGIWSGGDTQHTFGNTSGDIGFAGDWDGNGKDQIGVKRGHYFLLDSDGNGVWNKTTDKTFLFGQGGDQGIIGNWNADAKDEIGAKRGNKFFLDVSGDGRYDYQIDRLYVFGNTTGDIGISGDWNDDGKNEIGVQRGNKFYLDSNSNGVWDAGSDALYTFGNPTGDKAIIGDWDGDGRDEIGVKRGNQFFLDSNGNGVWDPEKPITLNIAIDGPASQIFEPIRNFAVLANLRLNPNEGQVDIRSLSILIEGRKIDGSPLSQSIPATIDIIGLRNRATGRTIQGSLLTQDGDSDQEPVTYQIYRFENFFVTSGEVWELRGDIHGQDGDRLRAHVCANQAPNGTCSFAGIVFPEKPYGVDARSVSSGTPVAKVTPGGTVSGNAHEIALPLLHITQKMTGTSDSAVEYQKNVNLLRFEANAEEGGDLLFTGGSFTAAQGSLLNGQNYALWVDTDDDGVVDVILEDGVSPQSGRIVFMDIAGGGYVVPSEEGVIFEVHTDIAGSLTDQLLQLQFETSAANYLSAEELDDGDPLSGIETDGNCPSEPCQIIVRTTSSEIWQLYSQGDLFVTKDSSPLRPRQLLGGSLSEAILRLQLHADHEAIDVTDLQFTSIGNMADSVDRLELFRDGEAVPFAMATISGCGSDRVVTSYQGIPVRTFCANMENRQLVVPKGSDVDVTGRLRMKSDPYGAFSGEDIQFFVSGDTVNIDGAVRARGDASSNNLSANDGDRGAEGEVFIGTSAAGANSDIVGNPNEVVLAKITSIKNANTDAHGTAVPTGIYDFAQFKFSTASHVNTKNGLNDVVIDGIIFNVAAVNVQMNGDSFQFFNKEDATMKKGCEATNASGVVVTGQVTGSFFVRCTGLDADAVNTEIDQGSDAIFVLEGSITNPQINGALTSTLQAVFSDFTSFDATDFGVTSSHIRWIDRDGGASVQMLWIEYPDTAVKSTSYQS